MQRSLADEILYGRAQDHARIFVSSKMRDGMLKNERRAAIDAIDALSPHRAWAWERDASAGPYSSAAICVKHAETSDGLVLILADDLTPITKREYDAARRANVPRYIFLKADVARSHKATAFVNRERSRLVVTQTFRNEAELGTLIRRALTTYLLRSLRTSIVPPRGSR